MLSCPSNLGHVKLSLGPTVVTIVLFSNELAADLHEGSEFKIPLDYTSEKNAMQDEPNSNSTALPAATNRDRLRAFLDYLIMAAIGLILAVSWIDERYWGAAWLGMFGYVWRTYGLPGPVAFRRGLCLGTVAILAAFHWVPQILNEAMSLSYPNCLLLFFVLSMWDGFQFGLVALLVPCLKIRYPILKL